MEVDWVYAHKHGLLARHSIMNQLHEEGWPEDIARAAALAVPADKDGRGTIYSYPLALEEARRLAELEITRLGWLIPARAKDIARAESDIARWRQCEKDETALLAVLQELLA